jgi:hypothetical protein
MEQIGNLEPFLNSADAARIYRMSAAGQSRQFVCLPVTSGLPRSTDII